MGGHSLNKQSVGKSRIIFFFHFLNLILFAESYFFVANLEISWAVAEYFQWMGIPRICRQPT